MGTTAAKHPFQEVLPAHQREHFTRRTGGTGLRPACERYDLDGCIRDLDSLFSGIGSRGGGP